MHIGLLLIVWIALAIGAVVWVHLRAAPQGHSSGYRRRRPHQQAVVDPNWSRSLPGRAR
jgi:hypothetical protein